MQPAQQPQPVQQQPPQPQPQPMQAMATQQLADPYAGRRLATQSMEFSSRPSVLPTSGSENALMGATGVMGAPIGSAQARDAAETQVLQPTAQVPPTVPMTAGQTQTLAYGQNAYTQTIPYAQNPYVAGDAAATPAAGSAAYGARAPRSAQSARVSSSATPGYAGDEDSVSLEDTPAYGTQVGTQVGPQAGMQAFDGAPAAGAAATGYIQSAPAGYPGSGQSGESQGSANPASQPSHSEGKPSSSGNTARVVAIIVVAVLVIIGIVVALNHRSGSGAGDAVASSSSATSALATCQDSVNRYNDSRNRWNTVVSDASAASAVTADQVQDASTVANLQLALKATVPDLAQCDTSATDAQLQQTTSLNNDAADTLQKNADAVTAAAQKVTDSKSAKDAADASAQASASQQQQQEDAQKLAQAQSDLKSTIDAANAELSEAQQRLGATDPDVQQFQQEIAASQQVLGDSSADYATVSGSTSTLASATSYMKRRVDSAVVDADKDPNSPASSASASSSASSGSSQTEEGASGSSADNAS